MQELYIWLAAAIVFCAFVAITFFRPLGNGPWPDSRLKALDERRIAFAQIIGGAAIIFTFAWAFLKDSETLEQARQQIANQDYVAGAQMLSQAGEAKQSDNGTQGGEATKAAGVYALGRVADIRSEYRMAVRDTLAAFIAVNTEAERSDWNARSSLLKKRLAGIAGVVPDPWMNADDRLGPIGRSVQAALDVLARRNRTGEDLDRPLSLDNAWLVRANLSGATGTGLRDASFQGAVLAGAQFDHADMSGARFDGAHMGDWEGYGASSWTPLVPQRSEWSDGERAWYRADFTDSKLIGTNFEGAVLSGADFTRADLADAKFAGANLSRAIFVDAKNLHQDQFDGDHKRPACADDPAQFDSNVTIKLTKCRH
jgi:hypothetical protein